LLKEYAMMWFILGALGFGAFCALGSPRRQYNTYNTYNDDSVVEAGYDSCCDGDRDE
jgi:hypothetical protein